MNDKEFVSFIFYSSHIQDIDDGHRRFLNSFRNKELPTLRSEFSSKRGEHVCTVPHWPKHMKSSGMGMSASVDGQWKKTTTTTLQH